MNRRWKAISLALLIATITVMSVYVKVYATLQESSSMYVCYIVWELDHQPEKYWNLTEPDPYILEAIEHPGECTEPFPYTESTFWYTAIWDDGDPETTHPIQPVPFKYNGTYYDYMFYPCCTYLRVTPLDEEPEAYWNLTNPSKYLLEAIKNPGKTIVVGMDSPLGLGEHKGFTFLYNGTYYEYDISSVDWASYPLPKLPKPESVAAGLGATWVIAGLIYVVASRKTKKI